MDFLAYRLHHHQVGWVAEVVVVALEAAEVVVGQARWGHPGHLLDRLVGGPRQVYGLSQLALIRK